MKTPQPYLPIDPMNRRPSLWKRLRLPKCSQRLSRNQRPNPLRHKRSQISNPATRSDVEGFGWLEYQGPNHCEYGADIYENGNKIGIMG